MTVDGVTVSGRANDVSVADIRAAIAADSPAVEREARFRNITLPSQGGKPSHVKVVSKNEIHLYWGGVTHHIVKRVQGKWKFYGGIIVTS